ncbi:MAG: tetratricopeptide repeat protein, partial [Erysipelotrichia bacterium]|nr:tetratricopeptide repeat protein [Erysipelotrichia bacterium]
MRVLDFIYNNSELFINENRRKVMLYAELVKSFTQYRFIDKQKAKQTLAQMKEFEKNNEEYAFCSCFYEAQSYYDAGDLEQSVKYAIECIANLMKRPYRVELAKSYNLIGMINLTRGDILEAIDYFLNALEIARKHKEEELESYIYNNLGCTYHQLKDYQTGILYVTKAYNLLAKRDSNKESKMVFALNLALMHCEEEEWEQTQYYYQVAISDSSVFNMEANTILLAIVQIMMAYHKKNHKIIYEKIDCIAKEIQKNGLNLDDFNELVHMIRKIMNPSLKNKLHMLLLLLDKEVDSLLSTDSKIAVLCCKIEYYKMINEQDKMNDLLTDFYELSLQKERENEKTFLESANIKLQMQA